MGVALTTEGHRGGRSPGVRPIDPREFENDLRPIADALTLIPELVVKQQELENQLAQARLTEELAPIARDVAIGEAESAREVQPIRARGARQSALNEAAAAEDTAALRPRERGVELQELGQRERRAQADLSPVKTEIFTTPDGGELEVKFREIEFADGRVERQVIEQKQRKTGEEASLDRREREARVKATEALATQRTTTRPKVQIIRGGGVNAGPIGYSVSYVDPQTGRVVVENLDFEGNPLAGGGASAGGLVLPGQTNAQPRQPSGSTSGRQSAAPPVVEADASVETGVQFPRFMTPEEAAAAPPGTRFIGTDGIVRVTD